MSVAIDASPAEQEQYKRTHRWSAAVKAGLLGGAVVWLFPGGNPWTAFVRPSGAFIMGRPVIADQSITMFSMQAFPAHLAHFAVSILFALIILAVVYRLRAGRAIFAGIGVGLLLYAINFAVFRAIAPAFTGPNEISVALAHVLFGGITAGAIRGFLRPPQSLDPTKPNPGPNYSAHP